MPLYGFAALNSADSINAGLTVCLPLNEGAGQVVRDISNYRWHGRGVNSPTTQATRFGYARKFDTNSYIEVPARSSQPVALAFTYSVWIQGSGTLPNYAGLFAQTRSLANDGGISISNFGTDLVCYYDDNVDFTTGVALSSVLDSRPHLFTFGRKDGIDYTWLDGALVRSVSNAAGPLSALVGNLKIGSERSGTAGLSWQNCIMMFRGYNRLLQTNEVRRLYADPWAGMMWQRRQVVSSGPPPGPGPAAWSPVPVWI